MRRFQILGKARFLFTNRNSLTVRLSLLDTLRAILALTRLAVSSKFRLRGKYWKWRDETAFGSGPSISRWSRWHSMLEYGAWVARMRHLTR